MELANKKVGEMSEKTTVHCDECGSGMDPTQSLLLDHFGVATTRGTKSDFCSVLCLLGWLRKSMPQEMDGDVCAYCRRDDG